MYTHVEREDCQSDSFCLQGINKKTMTPIKWEPFKEVDRFFEDRLTFPSISRIGLDLAVDMYEEDDDIIAKMSLPGIDEIHVRITDDLLNIEGKRDDEEEIAKRKYYSKEIRRGSFSRSVNVPNSVNGERSRALYKDGFLIIRMPLSFFPKRQSVDVPVDT